MNKLKYISIDTLKDTLIEDINDLFDTLNLFDVVNKYIEILKEYTKEFPNLDLIAKNIIEEHLKSAIDEDDLTLVKVYTNNLDTLSYYWNELRHFGKVLYQIYKK